MRRKLTAEEIPSNGRLEIPKCHAREDASVRHLPIMYCRSPHEAQGEIREFIHVDAEIDSGKPLKIGVILTRKSKAQLLVQGKPRHQLRNDMQHDLRLSILVEQVLASFAEQQILDVFLCLALP